MDNVTTNGTVNTQGADLDTVTGRLTTPAPPPQLPAPDASKVAEFFNGHVRRLASVRDLQAKAFEVRSQIDALADQRDQLETAIKQEIAAYQAEATILEALK